MRELFSPFPNLREKVMGLTFGQVIFLFGGQQECHSRRMSQGCPGGASNLLKADWSQSAKLDLLEKEGEKAGLGGD